MQLLVTEKSLYINHVFGVLKSRKGWVVRQDTKIHFIHSFTHNSACRIYDFTNERMPCCSTVQTCILYSPGLCELCIWGHRLSFPNSHILDKGHGRRVDVGTFKVIICTNGSLKVPVSIGKMQREVRVCVVVSHCSL